MTTRAPLTAVIASLVLFAPAITAGDSTPTLAPDLYIAVTHEKFGSGSLQVLSTAPTWDEESENAASTYGHTTLRDHGSFIYAVNTDAGTLQRFNTWTGRVSTSINIGKNARPVDIAVVHARLAYITRENSSRLYRIDPVTGAGQESIDLAQFGGLDANPNLSMMLIHEDRLFVQMQRINQSGRGPAYEQPMLAVIDLATETIIDADPLTAGTQAIALHGTFPKFKMHVEPVNRKLFVSATGVFHDLGGIERINLDTLTSEGILVPEADSFTVGSDVGAFVIVSPTRGYLIYSTDLLLSSHLHEFSLIDGSVATPEPVTILNYYVPHIAFDESRNLLFIPTGGGFGPNGIHVVSAESGERLTKHPIPVSGQPSDLVLIDRSN